jgi:hypothetical protein
MSWRAAARRFRIWLAHTSDGRVNSTPATPEASIGTGLSQPKSALTQRNRTERVRLHTRNWRRRILLRKGARIHGRMVSQSDACSLAVLDTAGLVVCWYDGLSNRSAPVGDVVNCHVAQFYAPTHLAGMLACGHLRRAASQGGSLHTGWRRQPGGPAFLAITEIRPFVLRDGRVQGFLHIIRAASGQQQHHPAPIASRPFGYAAAHGNSGEPCAASNQTTIGAATLHRDPQRMACA